MSAHFPNLANGAAQTAQAGGNGATPPPIPAAVSAATPPGGWQFAKLMRVPGDPIVNQRFEFGALSQKVREHLVNQIGAATRDEAARMLWVQGYPGEGKSEGCLVTCLKAGFHVMVLSASMLAGKEEGAPIELIHAIMDEAVRWSAAYRCRVVIIIDDFDLSIANVDDNTGKTIHSNLLVNEFMSLADKRHLYRNVDGSNIGFIITVNDATGMRESLTRSGRANIYDHIPSFEDKANIAHAILEPKTSEERALVQALVEKHAKRQPVSFWKALYFEMRSLHARRLTSNGMPNSADVDRAYGQRLPLTPEIAWQAATNVRLQKIKKHLKNRRSWRPW